MDESVKTHESVYKAVKKVISSHGFNRDKIHALIRETVRDIAKEYVASWYSAGGKDMLVSELKSLVSKEVHLQAYELFNRHKVTCTIEPR